MNRRGFLGFLSTAPLAARAAAEKVLEQTGYSVLKPTLPTVAVDVEEPRDAYAGIHQVQRARKLRKLAAALLSVKGEMPAWKERELRHRAMHQFQGLDPDIAANVSMAVWLKIKLQRERNYERLRIAAIAGLTESFDRAEWSHKHETDWYTNI